MCDNWGEYLGDCYGCGVALYNLHQNQETVLDDELDEYFCGDDCQKEYYLEQAVASAVELA